MTPPTKTWAEAPAPSHEDRLQRSELRIRSLTPAQRALLATVDSKIERGLALAKWWEQLGNPHAGERFVITDERGQNVTAMRWPNARVPGLGTLPLLGLHQTQPFTGVKAPPSERKAAAPWMQQQIRRFVLRYFLRVTSQARAQTYPQLGRLSQPRLLQGFSSCPASNLEAAGVRLKQTFFKLRDGRIGRFAKRDAYAIVDLTELGSVYEWVLLKADLLQSALNLTLFGRNSPSVVFPIQRQVFLALCQPLTRIRDPEQGQPVGSYGPGFVYLELDPLKSYSFLPAFETVRFEASRNGQVQVQMDFICRQPDRSLVRSVFDPNATSTSLQPVVRTLDLSQLLAGPRTGSHATPTRGQLEFLYEHSVEQRSMLLGALQTWNRVPDWLREEEVPQYVRSGRFPPRLL